MGGKLNIYNLGVSGVVVDKSPIHELDGELLRAQNAQVDSVGVLGGIRKRDGFAQLNAIPLAGAVTGMLPLPLPDEGAAHPVFYLPQELAGPNWQISTNGTTWTSAGQPTRAVISGIAGLNVGNFAGTPMWRGFRGKLYYPGNDYTPGTDLPTIHMWDGTDDTIIARVTQSQFQTTPPKQITSLIPYGDHQLLVAVADGPGGPNGRSRVFILDTNTHFLSQVGADTDLTDGFIYGGMVMWQGRLWIGALHGAGGSIVNVYWARPGARTWTSELTTNGSAHGYITSMVVFKGNLYVSFGADLNAHGDIYQRTPQGVWSEVYASDGMGALNFCGPMVVSADGSTLLAYQNSVSGGVAPQLRIIQTTNGTTWTLAYNISTNLDNTYARSGAPYVDPKDGNIYWPLASGDASGNGGLLKRTSTGVWSIVLSGQLAMRGPMGIVRV